MRDSFAIALIIIGCFFGLLILGVVLSGRQEAELETQFSSLNTELDQHAKLCRKLPASAKTDCIMKLIDHDLSRHRECKPDTVFIELETP